MKQNNQYGSNNLEMHFNYLYIQLSFNDLQQLQLEPYLTII